MDGSVLSAPFDPEAAKSAPPARDTSPPRTEVLTGGRKPESVPPTRAATPQNLQPTITAPPFAAPSFPTHESSTDRPTTVNQSRFVRNMLIAIAIAVAVVIAVFMFLALGIRLGSPNTNTNRTNTGNTAPVTSASPTATELNIRISHNDCATPGFEILVSADNGFAEHKKFRGPSDDFQVTVKHYLSLRYNYWAFKCMELTINGRRAKFPTNKNDDETVLITTDNYQQFLE